MPRRRLSAVPSPLRVTAIAPAPDQVDIAAGMRTGGPWPCPDCRAPSARVHGHYRRQLADLPWQGRAVAITVRVRRLACANPACPRRTFAEPLECVAAPFARRSGRLASLQRHLGLALGGEAGSRMAARLCLPASADTLIRLVCAAEVAAPASPRVVGIDEWAWRKGRNYGTAIVDLERNRVVDLLPDRDEHSVAGWLRDHPGVDVVARDRAEVYGEGARRGAPNATHVADRWHLLRNLSAALQAEAARHHAALRQAAHETALHLARPDAPAEPLGPTAAKAARAARHAARDARHAELVRLHDAGMSVSGMARTLGMDRKTVRAWLSAGAPPRWTRPRAGARLDREAAFMTRRWSEGCRRVSVLRRELAGRGCVVPRSTVGYWIMTRLAGGAPAMDAAPSAAAWRPPTVTGTSRLLQADRVGGHDGLYVTRLLELAPDLAHATRLARRLGAILRKASAETLDGWLCEAGGSPLKGLARGLAKDRAAVQAAVDLPWSTSPVEGQINCLKLIKRAMYSRGGFHLLRQRVLLAT
ncbi:MAG TPA: ISL3 family transposase, partial [Alphaproteobacteria bacterium]|nr:ISL3 family transposase [Alphaproteobacteria bacterium]